MQIRLEALAQDAAGSKAYQKSFAQKSADLMTEQLALHSVAGQDGV